MATQRENNNPKETSLDILARGIDERSNYHIILASDPECEGATLISLKADNPMELMFLLADLFTADESLIELFDTAKLIAKERVAKVMIK